MSSCACLCALIVLLQHVHVLLCRHAALRHCKKPACPSGQTLGRSWTGWLPACRRWQARRPRSFTASTACMRSRRCQKNIACSTRGRIVPYALEMPRHASCYAKKVCFPCAAACACLLVIGCPHRDAHTCACLRLPQSNRCSHPFPIGLLRVLLVVGLPWRLRRLCVQLSWMQLRSVPQSCLGKGRQLFTGAF